MTFNKKKCSISFRIGKKVDSGEIVERRDLQVRYILPRSCRTIRLARSSRSFMGKINGALSSPWSII
jgi:hypothetical protein